MISGTPFFIVDIDEAWPEIAKLVASVDPMDNAGDDLRKDCREGRAICLLSSDGVLVVELQPNRYGNGEFDLFVRLSATSGPAGSIQRNDAYLDAIARDMGPKVTHVTFNTLRPGMHKVLNPEWSVRYTAFERKVHGL